MKNIYIDGKQPSEIFVFDGLKYRRVIGKIMTTEGLKRFYSPIDFKDDFSSRTGLVHQTASTLIKEQVLFEDNFKPLKYGTDATTINSNVGEILNVTSTTLDPKIRMEDIGSFDPNIFRFVEFRYRILNGIPTEWEVFFTNDLYTYAHGAHRISGGVLNADGQWHTAYIDCWSHASWKSNGNIRGFRLDWATTIGVNMEIDYVKATNMNNTVIPVQNSAGLTVGQVVTITDSLNSEDVRILSVGTNEITITPITKNYKYNTLLSRSNSIIDSSLKFNELLRYTITIS